MNRDGKKLAKNIAAYSVITAMALTLTGGVFGGGPGGGGPGGGRGSGGGSGGSSGESDQAARKTVVEAKTPELGSIAVRGTFVGTVEPGRQVTVYPKASGEIVEVFYGVGDTVEAGAVLFKLDATALELDLAEAQANLSKNKAKEALNLDNARRNMEGAQRDLNTAQRDLNGYENDVDDGLNADLLSAEQSVKSAEISLQTANVDYRNARQDYTDYNNEEGDWEDYTDAERERLRGVLVKAELEVEKAQLSLENAKSNLEIVKKRVEDELISSENQVADAESGLQSAENSVKTAEINNNFSADAISLQKLQNNLENYTVTAPIGGVIEQKNVEVFDTATTQLAAFVISNKDSVSISFEVAESALSYLNPGDAVVVDKNGETCSGTVTEVSPMVNPESGLYTVKASVERAPFELRSGSAVKLRAETQKVENGMLVPIDAVYYDNGEPYVFLFEGNTARRADVTLGISDDRYIQILSGLSMSDNVIVTYSTNLYDGAEVYLPGTAPEENTGAGTGSKDGGAPESGAGPPEPREGGPAGRENAA